MDTSFAITFFGALFAMMNPVTSLPIFLSVTDGAPVAVQRKIALKTAFYCLVLGGGFAIAGNQILAMFGITVDDFRVAGGLVVLMIGLNMLNGKESSSHSGTAAEKENYPTADTVAFYPLTFPMIVGPGTITTLIIFANQATTTPEKISFVVVFVGVVALLGLTFYNAPALSKYLTGTTRVIMTRLMGMILAAVAVDMMAQGLKHLLPGLS